MPAYEINKEVVREAVVQTLLSFGIDVSDSEAIVHFQRDMHHLRKHRLNEENIATKAGLHVITMVLSAIGATIIMGAVGIFKGS